MTLLAAVALALFLVALGSAMLSVFGVFAVPALILAAVFAVRSAHREQARREAIPETRITVRLGGRA